MSFSSFADELQKIAAFSHILGGAALGALGAGLTGNQDHIGKAMIGGAVLGSGVKTKGDKFLRYSWKTPAALSVIGGTGIAMSEGVPKQVAYDTTVADRYASAMANQRGITPGPWS